MKLFFAASVLALLVASTASAAKGGPIPTGTISGPNEPGPYAFQDVVHFTTTASGLKGYQYPMVYVECRSVVDDALLYGQLDYPDAGFVLGGGSSPWFDDRDDAHCTADIRIYGGKRDQGQVVLDSVTFDATG